MKTAYSGSWSIFYLHVQALARCHDLQKTVSEQSSGVRAVQEERDIAVATLRQQNKELHAVIRHMRQEMEQLTGFSEQGDSEPHRQTGDNGEALTVGYVKYMERAAQVPRSKVHQKLLQATRAIIGLVM